MRVEPKGGEAMYDAELGRRGGKLDWKVLLRAQLCRRLRLRCSSLRTGELRLSSFRMELQLTSAVPPASDQAAHVSTRSLTDHSLCLRYHPAVPSAHATPDEMPRPNPDVQFEVPEVAALRPSVYAQLSP